MGWVVVKLQEDDLVMRDVVLKELPAFLKSPKHCTVDDKNIRTYAYLSRIHLGADGRIKPNKEYKYCILK